MNTWDTWTKNYMRFKWRSLQKKKTQAFEIPEVERMTASCLQSS